MSKTSAIRSSVIRVLRSPALMGVVALALLTSYFVSGALPIPFELFIFNTCMLAALGAIGLNVLIGTAGQVSIGNAAFLAVGGFTAVALERNGVAFPLTVIGAALVAAALGAVLGLPALRLRGIYLALATLAAHFVVLYVAERYQTNEVGQSGFLVAPLFASRGLDGSQDLWAWLLLGTVSVVGIVAWVLTRSKMGRAWRIIRDHEGVAPALGIDVTRYKLLAFSLSSSIIGLQGALTVHFIGSLTTENFTLLLAFSYIAMVMIGGLDSVEGAVIGAFVVTSLPTVIPKLIRPFVSGSQAALRGPQFAVIIYGLLLIVFVTKAQDGIVSLPKQAVRRIRRASGHSRRSAVALPKEPDSVPSG